MLIEFAVAVVAFGGARWGRPPTVVVSGLSIPAGLWSVVVAVTADVDGRLSAT